MYPTIVYHCAVCPFQTLLSICSHLSLLLGSGFDHAAEATIPVLLNLLPNSAKIMATSGVAAVRIILKVSDVPLFTVPIVQRDACSIGTKLAFDRVSQNQWKKMRLTSLLVKEGFKGSVSVSLGFFEKTTTKNSILVKLQT